MAYRTNPNDNLEVPLVQQDADLVESFRPTLIFHQEDATVFANTSEANDALVPEKLKLEFCNYDVEYLLEKLKANDEFANELIDIIGDCNVEHKNYIHGKARAPTCGDFTIFYRYFFSKCISNRQQRNAESERLKICAATFPIKINPTLSIRKVVICDLFDDEFLAEIQQFVQYHFGECNFRNLIDLFVTNVDAYKVLRIKEDIPFHFLKRFSETGSSVKSWRKDPSPKFLSKYINVEDRVTKEGVMWYQRFQTVYNKLAERYDRKLLQEKAAAYFLYLPEINLCELLLLLEEDFFVYFRKKYIYLFEKYLFFFGHAINADPHPVFYIDDTLFACLQSLRRYETFQGDIFSLQWELWMMTLVHRRKHPLPVRRVGQTINPYLDDRNLGYVLNRAEKIPNVRSAAVYYEEPEYPLRFRIFLVYDEVVFLMGYSRRHFDRIECFFSIILKCALVSRKIQKIIHYNAYWGEEHIIDMPSRKGDIINLIRRCNVLKPKHPEGFPFEGSQNYFVNPNLDNRN